MKQNLKVLYARIQLILNEENIRPQTREDIYAEFGKIRAELKRKLHSAEIDERQCVNKENWKGALSYSADIRWIKEILGNEDD